MPKARLGGLAAAMAAGVAAAATAAIGAELAPFLAAHRQAIKLTDAKQWTQAAKVYAAFAAEHAADASASLASILQGILLRRELQRPAEARAAFLRAAKAPQTPFGRELRRVALGWLARLQMEPVDAALRKYWVDEIEYPLTLERLAERKLVDPKLLVDPWGKPLVYQTGRLRIAPEIPRQSYTLRCAAIEGTSRDFKRLLAESAAFARKHKVRAIAPSSPRRAIVAPARGSGEGANVAEGGKVGSARVIKIGLKAVILVDGESIAVLML